jgi:D-xylose transport system ATP-binding protein
METNMNDDYILAFDNVSKEFPGVKALSQVTFKVKKGEIHGLCGENGAGKSTLMKILSGVYPYKSYTGNVFYKGEELRFTGESIKQAAKKGIAIVYQELATIPNMTVGENIFLGREPTKGSAINWNKLYSDTKKILDEYKLDISYTEQIRNLGVGQEQMVEIAKAISENAEILILDEPTSALTEDEIENLMRILEIFKSKGMTCIYISHKLEEIIHIADTITVLRDGIVVDTVMTKDITTDKIISMMVGRELKERFPYAKRALGDVLFEVKNFTSYYPNQPEKKCVDDVSFTVRQGEVLGISGLMGSGRTELVTTLFGEYGIKTTGHILIDNREVRNNSARQAMENGLGLIPEDRKKLGLVLINTIIKNISLPNLNQFASFFRINSFKERKSAQEIADNLHIKASSLLALLNTLSGGNQQKVVIAKWLLSSPKVLILDEPTRGIDVGAKYEIYKLINTLAEQGKAIILVSSELPEIMGMCDRILVMYRNKCKGILKREEATQEKIMTIATGLARE